MIAGAFCLGRSRPAPFEIPRASSAAATNRRIETTEDGASYVLAEGTHACIRSNARNHVAIYAFNAHARAARLGALEALACDDKPLDVDTLPRLEWVCVRLQRDGERLTMVSDLMGVYPLYHAQAGDVVYWSTSPYWVLEHLPERAICDEYMAAALVGLPTAELTPWKSLQALRPCHRREVFRSGRAGEKLYWRPERVSIERMSDEEARKALRASLEASVAARLDAGGTSWFELSGGLDSSTLACFAARQVSGHGHASTPRLLTYVDDSLKRDSEAPFVEAASDACGLEHVTQLTSSYPFLAEQHGLMPDFRTCAQQHLEQFLASNGPALIVSGRFGDAGMGNSVHCPESLISICKHEGPGAFASELLHVACATRSTIWKELKGIGAWLMPGRWRAWAEAREQRAKNEKRWRTEMPYFSARSRQIGRDLADVFASSQVLSTGPLESRRLQSVLHTAIRARLYANENWLHDVHITHPYLDWPLVKLVLSIPAHLLVRPGKPRRLMRLAIDGVVPDRIRLRTGKSYAAEPIMRRMRLYMRGFLDAPVLLVAERGYIETSAFKTTCERVLSGATTSIGRMRNIIIVENWLRQLEAQAQIQPTVIAADLASPWRVRTPRKGGECHEPVRDPEDGGHRPHIRVGAGRAARNQPGQ